MPDPAVRQTTTGSANPRTLRYRAMRFVKVHPAFLVFFFLSLIALVVACFVAGSAADACVDSNGTHHVDADCTLSAQSRQNVALVIAIGGLTAMLGGVGFQVGRSANQAASSQPQGGYPAGAPPYPPPQR
jgi:hypothetical protein